MPNYRLSPAALSEYATVGFTWLHAEKHQQCTYRNYISVEGNIAAGKSVFMSTAAFNEHGNVVILPEPIDRWRNYHGKNLLSLAYRHPYQYTNQFQECVHETINDALASVPAAIPVISERSVQCAMRVFAPLMQQKGYITTEQLRSLQARPNNRQLGLSVYLHVPPERAYERLLRRQRPEELGTVSLAYLQQLHLLHNNWLVRSSPGHPVILVDGSHPQAHNVYARVAASVASFLFNQQ